MRSATFSAIIMMGALVGEWTVRGIMEPSTNHLGPVELDRRWAADGIRGVYLKDNDISPLDDGPRQLRADCIPAEVASHAIDPVSAARLWALSERLVGGEAATTDL